MVVLVPRAPAGTWTFSAWSFEVSEPPVVPTAALASDAGVGELGDGFGAPAVEEPAPPPHAESGTRSRVGSRNRLKGHKRRILSTYPIRRLIWKYLFEIPSKFVVHWSRVHAFAGARVRMS
jgi:hypothetical protein